MIRLLKSIHLYGTYKGVCTFLINHVFTSMKPFSSNIKCAILRSVGHRIGKGTTIVSPVYIIGKVEIGDACWINRGFTVQGDGLVRIGDNCDIAPDVSFLTGGHQIGTSKRRAGTGEVYTITVGNGCWIGARSTLLGNIVVNDGSVVAACTCVNRDVPENVVVGGVPAKVIRRLDSEDFESSEK